MTIQAISAWLLAIIITWTPAQVPQVPLPDLSHDIATVVVEEDPIWQDDTSKHHTAMILASLGYWEGARFAAYVDDQRCNEWVHTASANPIWRIGNDGVRRSHPDLRVLPEDARHLIAYGSCDGGNAYSLWQIWPFATYTPAVLSDRQNAIRGALVLLRKSYANRGNLSGYTGESSQHHPKADEREAFAERYW